MSSGSMQVVLRLFPPEFREGRLDMCELIDQDPFWTLITELFEPDAEVRFITPDAGDLGGMAGPFRGPAGFRAGWREWVKPYDSFRVEVEQAQTTPDDRVVLLVKTFASLQGSSVEVEQPSAVVYAVRDGRIAAADHYLEHEQALRDAGLA
jgi:ketosteroid isomerase-like protein